VGKRGQRAVNPLSASPYNLDFKVRYVKISPNPDSEKDYRRSLREMKVSAQEEYGLRCLVQLAHLREGESLTLSQIARGEGISVANAGELLWIMNEAGLVQSMRGHRGGYQL